MIPELISPAGKAATEAEMLKRGIGTAKSLLEIYPPLKSETPGELHPQEQFILSEAQITIYGGSAGGAKTVGELLDAAQHVDNPRYGAVIFRRTMKQVTDEGGIWDASAELYTLVGAKPNSSGRFWTFKSGATIQFAGLETEAAKYTYQGSQICGLYFDELTHFLESQFFYLLSRNRSTCGITPKVKATTNPEPGWVKRLLAPWVDRTFKNRAKSGEVRWFIRENNQIVWVEKPPDRGTCEKGKDGGRCLKDGCEQCFPPEKSITFIRASVYDNRPLLEADPGYIGNLKAMHDIDRKRLLDGDWDVKPAHRVIASFDESQHVVAWREVPKSYPRNIGADFGKLNGAEVAIVEYPDGKLLAIGENWPGEERTFEEQAADMIRICGGITPKRAAGGNVTTEQGWRQSMRKEGIPFEEPDPKHADPGLQYQCVSDAFASGELEIMEGACPKLIGMLNDFQHILDDDGEPTDKFKDTPYHLLAALRGIITRLRPPKAKRQIVMEAL